MPDLGFTELFTRQDADYGSRTFTAADPWLVSWSFGTYPRQPTARVGPRRPGETISSNKPRQLSGNVRLQRRAEHEIPDLGDTAAGTRTPSGAPYRRVGVRLSTQATRLWPPGSLGYGPNGWSADLNIYTSPS
jgi:hypothetical protein